MKFGSIKEYFYKLYNYSLLLVLVPPSVFVFLYFVWPKRASYSILEKDEMVVLILSVVSALVIGELTIVHLYLRRHLRKLSAEAGLGNKMDGYVTLAMLRQFAASSAAMVLAICFYFTASNWSAIFFVCILLWTAWHWPSPKRFCKDLSVRSDERELILNSKESF